MPRKLLRLKRPDHCAACSMPLEIGTKAWWDPSERTTTCQSCEALAPGTSQSPVEHEVEKSPITIETRPPIDLGVAGESAKREYEKRHQRREQRIEQTWGRFAGIVKFLSDDPQSITAWAKGSEGERRLAARLQRDIGERAVLLNDRKVPKTRGNIDHLVIASSGIWVIDAKNYKGKVERRDVGGWFKVDTRLYVGGRDRTKIAGGLDWQINAVRCALNGDPVPITGALCFTDAEWGFFAKPFRQDGAWVTWAGKLVEMIGEPGPITSEEIFSLAARLSFALPPVVSPR